MKEKKDNPVLVVSLLALGAAWIGYMLRNKFPITILNTDKVNKQVSFSMQADGSEVFSDTFRLGDQDVQMASSTSPYFFHVHGDEELNYIQLNIGTLSNGGAFTSKSEKIVWF